MILERVTCGCKCPVTVFETDGPRCLECNHQVKIELTDRWEDPLVWIDPQTRRPVRLDEILSH